MASTGGKQAHFDLGKPQNMRMTRCTSNSYPRTNAVDNGALITQHTTCRLVLPQHGGGTTVHYAFCQSLSKSMHQCPPDAWHARAVLSEQR